MGDADNYIDQTGNKSQSYSSIESAMSMHDSVGMSSLPFITHVST